MQKKPQNATFSGLGLCGSRDSSTFRILVEMSDVLSGVTADALRADLLAHHFGGNDVGRAAIFVSPERFDVGVDLSEDKRSVVLEQEVALLDGPHWDRATAVDP